VRPHTYPAEELPLLSSIADHVAMAVDNALSHAELEHAQDRLKLLIEVTNRVVSSLDLQQVLRAVMATSRRVMRSDSAVVAVRDERRGQLRACALDFPGGQEIIQAGELIPLEGTVAGHVFRSGEPWVGDVDDLLRTGLEANAQWIAWVSRWDASCPSSAGTGSSAHWDSVGVTTTRTGRMKSSL
jgi:GAF domain-containing protein